ncbi:hypothetical protein WBJ53_14500 [Spirosoma sp. SC4-14]|uniref:hypothetical protein n=1 Tax=Spirosoma sp. SC4-14 TaxID=3128900 RepID=UPI0030CEBBB7
MTKAEKLAIVKQYYPNAKTTTDTINDLIRFIEDKLNMETSQILMADSVCADDVNGVQYPMRTREFYGPFNLAGLWGYPFTGLTGMGAFASHVPDGGAAFIYYGPHIGISKQGHVGEIHRFGQSANSSCCGAAIGALTKFNNKAIQEGVIDELNYQANTLEQLLLKNKERLNKSAEFGPQLMEVTEIAFEATDKRIQELISQTRFNNCQYIILLGIILINGDSDVGSFNAIKRFDIIDLTTNERTSYLSDLLD